MKKAVIIISGGLDSTTLLWKLVKEKYKPEEILAISFNYGQKQIKELEYAKWNCEHLGVEHRVIELFSFMKDFKSALTRPEIEIPKIDDVLGNPSPPTEVPFRNQLFFTIAAGIAQSIDATEIYTGLQTHDQYNYFDTSPEFIERFNDLIHLNRIHYITLVAPFAKYSKADEIREGLKLGVPYEKSRTCYKEEDDENCTCPSCSERRKGFHDNGIKDPLFTGGKIIKYIK